MGKNDVKMSNNDLFDPQCCPANRYCSEAHAFVSDPLLQIAAWELAHMGAGTLARPRGPLRRRHQRILPIH